MNADQDHPESEASGLTPDAGVVCTTCLEVNPPGINYCDSCGAPLNNLAAFNPFDQTLVEGFAYRRAVDGPPSKIILAGVWLIFGPSLALIPIVFANDPLPDRANRLFGLSIEQIYFAGYLLLSIAILYRATANYISKRKALKAANT